MSDYNMKGYLGKNKNIRSDKSPSHTGKCTIGGQDFWISAWVKEGKDGGKFFSLAFQKKDDDKQLTPAPASNIDTSEDVPF